MYKLLVALMLISALKELDVSLKDFQNCHLRQCLINIERASRKVTKIDWKPIMLFPEEAKKFQ